MSNWDYAANLDSPIWRGSMTLPRELRLINCNQELLLSSLPISEITSPNDYFFTMDAEIDSEIIIGSEDEKVVISFDAATKRISVDRSLAWFPGIKEEPQISPTISLEKFTLRLILDHGSLELFVPETGLSVTTLHTLPATSAILQKTEKPLQ
jgi:sucrose-6-phosphate hydrolase SacC (GH32 family)